MKRRMNQTERSQMKVEALNRAVSGQALTNYPAIIEGFMEKGIPADQILPRENVFTYDAWGALGRHVRKGEHGVKVVTWIERTKQERDADGNIQDKSFRFPKTTTVFHVSQTEPNEVKAAARVSPEVAYA